MYALIHNGKIKVGPRAYHKAFFSNYLKRLGVAYDLPVYYDTSDTIEITPDLQIAYVTDPTVPEYNKVTEQLSGPFWDTTARPIVGYYGVVGVNVDVAKNVARNIVAEKRYNREVSGFTMTVSGVDVTIDTSREDRNIWLQSLLLLPDGVNQKYKFNKEQVWLDLNKEDITGIVQSIVQHVQSAFDWEAEVVSLIDTAATKEELEALLLMIGNS